MFRIPVYRYNLSTFDLLLLKFIVQTRFTSLYDQAQQECWLVCVPRATSLEGCNITKQFIGEHLN